MPNGVGMAAFAQGLGTGMLTASRLAKEGVETDTERLKLKRMKDEQPVIDKELQVRGSKADYDLTEQNFKNSIQQFEQETKRQQSQTARTTAQVQGAEATSQLQRQPDELAVKREELNNQVLNSSMRQIANIYRVMKLGNKDLALHMNNDSQLVDPGKKATDMRFEDVDAPGPNGAPTKTKVMAITAEDGTVRRIPVEKLEALDNQFGATYQKAGNNIVRISRDGKVTPVYEADLYGNTPDSDIYSRRTGEVKTPAAAGGLPKPSSREQGRIDKRVTEGRAVVDRYYGISEFTKLDESAQPAYNAVVNRMGGLVRGGAHPEAAANQALLEQRDGRLNPDGSPKSATPKPVVPGSGPAAAPASGGGAGAYNGPTPWRR